MKDLWKLLIIGILAIISCKTEPAGLGEDEKPHNDNSAIVLDNGGKDLYLESTGGKLKVGFTSTASWNAKLLDVTDNSWISLSKSSGSAGKNEITVTAKKNETHEERFTYIIITSNNCSGTLKIVQKQDNAIIIDSKSIALEAGKATFSIKVSSNVSCEPSISCNWINMAGTKAMTETTFNFEAEENDGEERTATITFAASGLSETVTVIQKGKEAIILSANEISCSWRQTGIEITVNPKVSFSVDFKEEWITHVGSNSAGNILYFTVAENTGAERKADIVFKGKGFEESVRIIQEKRPEVLINEEDIAPVIAQTTTETIIRFTATSAWEARIMDTKLASEWLSVTPDHGDAGQYNLVIHTLKNEEVEDRTGYIHLVTATSEQVITVTQKQRDALTVSPGNLNVLAKGQNFNITAQHNVEYTIDIKCDWIKDITSKAFVSTRHTFACAPNPTDKERSAYIVFRSGEKSETITITQEAANLSIGSSTNRHQALEYLTGSIRITSNISFQARTDSDWITITRVNDSDNIIEYALSENRTGHDRTGTITAFYEGFYATTTLIQSGFYSTIDKEYFTEEGGVFTITVTNQYDYESTTEYAEWIQLISTKESEILTEYSFRVLPLQEVTSRETYLSFGRDDPEWLYTDRDYYSIRQEYQTSTNLDVLNIDMSGGIVDIDFTYADRYDNYSVSPEYYIIQGLDWISHIKTKNLETKTFSFLFDQNKTGAPREGKIEFVNPDGVSKRVVTIKQSATVDEIQIPDPVFREYLIKNYDDNGDGHINIQEDWRVTSIDISGLDVVSVEGIDKFPRLASFKGANCTKLENLIIPQGITSLEANAFSGCTSLTRLVIPDTVTSIGNRAFSNCSNLQYLAVGKLFNNKRFRDYIEVSQLTDIILRDGFSSFESYAFLGCINLISISIPDSLTSPIGKGTFSSCKNLKSIRIPDNVFGIDYNAFSNCSSLVSLSIGKCLDNLRLSSCFNVSILKDIEIRDSFSSFGESALSGCSSITSIKIPNTVSSISNKAFSGCTSLTSINIPSNVTSIGSSAFNGCTSLASISIPSGVTFIGSSAFNGCSSLTSINIPDKVTAIEESVFSGCKTLSSITITNKIISIGNNAFNGCSNLRSIFIPDSVASIGENAFSGCSSISSITIPDNVTLIGSGAFSDCSNLTEISVGKLFNNKKFSDCFDSSVISTIHLRESFSSFGEYALSNFTALSNIIIPNSVTSITNYVFRGCSSLSGLIIPQSVTSIGISAFSGCIGFTDIVIPDSIKSIGKNAFSGCTNLKSIIIPDSVTSIGEYAFYDCKQLGNITIGAFFYDKKVSSYFVSSAISHITLLDGFTCISSTIVNGLSNLKSITIPDSVTSIGNSAFKGCSSLESIDIPNSVSIIDDSTFRDCISLSYVHLPNSITTIQSAVFWGCTELTIIDIPNSVTSIKLSAFYGCTSLECITIPGSVKSIEGYVFYGCSQLSTIEIPEGVPAIESNTFRGCSNLNRIALPSTISKIEDYAFTDCVNLESFIIKAPKPPILGYTFEGSTAVRHVFDNVSSDLTIFVPSDNVEEYKKNWSQYASRIRSIDEYPGTI